MLLKLTFNKLLIIHIVEQKRWNEKPKPAQTNGVDFGRTAAGRKNIHFFNHHTVG